MSCGLSKEKFALLKMVENHKEKLLSLLENDSDFNDIMKSLDGINNCLITHLITSDKNIGEMSFYHDKSTFVQINDYRVIHYSNGVRHNENGPADYYIDSKIKNWYVNGLWHREDGPAFEGKDGKRYWCYKDKRYGDDDDFTIETWKEKVKELKSAEKLKIFI